MEGLTLLYLVHTRMECAQKGARNQAMTSFLTDVIILAFGILVGVIAFPYLKGYSTRKGENLATHDDIDKLVDQVKAVTKATEEIKGEISRGLIDRQRVAEMKREVLFDTMRRVAAVYATINTLQAVLKSQLANQTFAKSVDGMQMKIDKNNKYFGAASDLEESRLFVEVTCSPQVTEAISKFSALATTIAGKINEGDAEIFNARIKEFLDLKDGVSDAIRKELAIDGITSQSNVSSAAPRPVLPAPK
jgi:hypothetical protein